MDGYIDLKKQGKKKFNQIELKKRGKLVHKSEETKKVQQKSLKYFMKGMKKLSNFLMNILKLYLRLNLKQNM